MSLKNILRRAELASIEIAAGDMEWWNSLSKGTQKAYIKKHPKSSYAKKFGGSLGVTPAKSASTTSPKDAPKVRGAKALKKAEPLTTKPAEKKTTKPAPKAEKPVEKKSTKPAAKPEVKPKAKVADKKKSSGARGRPSSISPKEKIKHKQQRIKSFEERLKVLAAEKNYRNAARAYTKRDTTKERLADRIAKINEMVKGINSKIKAYTKRISELQKSMIK